MMKRRRYANSRQKACQNCSTTKAKCDQKARGCTRCSLRGLSCTYPQTSPQTQSPRHSTHDASNDEESGWYSPLAIGNTLSAPESLLTSPGCESSTKTDALDSVNEAQHSTARNYQKPIPSTPCSSNMPADAYGNRSTINYPPDIPDILDFSQLELLSPINVDDISNRWLNSYIPVPGQKIKEYPATITAFIYRILKSYASVTVRGRGVPPFVHSLQTTARSTRPPLSTCLSLVRICDNSLPGSENVAVDVLQREMTSLYEQHKTYDDVTLLAAFQAYLIYSLVLFFRLSQVPRLFLRQAMMNLQDLACSSSRGGLVCTAEEQRARPRWEAWIVAEAKRRTLFTMYLFDSVLLAQDNLQTFLGTELQGLPASSTKSLWGAQSRDK